MNEKEFVETAKRALKAGISVAQLAIMHGITEQRVYSVLHKHGLSVSELRSGQPTSRRMIRRRAYAKAVKRAGELEYKKQELQDAAIIRDLKKKLEGISNKRERWETAYGAAMLTFERRQARDHKRPPLPAPAPVLED